MVKNYKGVQVLKSEHPEVPAITVADYMAVNLITFKEAQPMNEAIEVLLTHKISGGPVVSPGNEIVGVISEGDCLKEVIKGALDNAPLLIGTVGEHMSTNVITINSDMSIFDAAKMFLSKRIRRFPVIENGKLVGQISQKDIMKAVLKLKKKKKL